MNFQAISLRLHSSYLCLITKNFLIGCGKDCSRTCGKGKLISGIEKCPSPLPQTCVHVDKPVEKVLSNLDSSWTHFISD